MIKSCVRKFSTVGRNTVRGGWKNTGKDAFIQHNILSITPGCFPETPKNMHRSQEGALSKVRRKINHTMKLSLFM